MSGGGRLRLLLFPEKAFLCDDFKKGFKVQHKEKVVEEGHE